MSPRASHTTPATWVFCSLIYYTWHLQQWLTKTHVDPQAQSKVESSLKSEAAAAAAAPSELTDDQHYTFSSSKKDKGNLAAAATTATNEGVTEPRSTPTTAINPEEGKPLDELTGKGPRPVEVLAKENGGNAAAAAVAATETDSSASVPAAPESKLADAENKNSSTNDGNMREATEEEYVESSGLAADGGDFDVTKPGAGLEADRECYSTLNNKTYLRYNV